MADLGQAGLAVHAAARRMLPGVEAGEGGDLPAGVETAGVAKEGQQDGDGALAQAGDAVEQRLFALHAGACAYLVLDRLGQRLDLLVEPVEMLLNALAHRVARDVQAVGLLRPHGFKGIQPQHQGAQGQLAVGIGLPRRGVALGAKVGDEPRVNGVGLRAGEAGSPVCLDLGRVGHADGKPARGKELGDAFPIHAGGLHAGVDFRRAVAGQPVCETFVALGVVGDHFAAEFAVGQAQGAVQLGFGNIDTEMKEGHGKPQMINLVNAGCRQAGPKILFDLELRAGGCCEIYGTGLVSQGRKRHAAALLGVPPKCAVLR